MKLDNDIKTLMAFLYSKDNILRYEFSFDKRDNHFYARIFFDELSYWTVSFVAPGLVAVREWHVTKTMYHPSPRVSYIRGTRLNKFRDGGSYIVNCTLTDLLNTLEHAKSRLGKTDDRYAYAPWRSIRRATGRF